MAIPKVCGIETEYGIVHRGTAESNPIEASSLLIRAYLHAIERGPAAAPAPNVVWDFVDETPGNDIRDEVVTDSLAPEVEMHLVNAVLTNGARYYVDHAHPELSTPECRDARSVVLYDRAAELIAVESMIAADRVLPEGETLVVYKNNSDGKGNSYGCHENYLLDRSTPFGSIVAHATAHFVTRSLYTGAGKVGCEIPGVPTREVPFQLTQRADFFEEEVGLETTLKRPIINTRDEPHADAAKYRRLHVIVGDANMSQIATYLKVGTTAIVLAMVEDDAIPKRFVFADPVRALQQVSVDLTLSLPIEMHDGTKLAALDIQWQLYEAARNYQATHGLDAVGDAVGADVLDRWEAVLTAIETDPMSLADQLDWVAKYRLIEGYRERHGLAVGDAKLAALGLQYHDLRPASSVFAKLGMQTLVDDADALIASGVPPVDTRAYFRGTCLGRFAPEIVAANWDSLVFDIDDGALRRVPMVEPLRGTRAHVGTLLEECDTAADLLARLDS